MRWEAAPVPSPAALVEPQHADSIAEPAASSDVVWPNETAGTAERAIVTEATSPLMRFNIWKDEILAWFRTLVSAAVYATLIVTFGFQVARVEGQSMAPTLADHDRLIVNKLTYRLSSPRRGDIVMLYYPPEPGQAFVKRVIAEEGDTVRIDDGRVYRERRADRRRLRAARVSAATTTSGRTVRPAGLLLRDGRPSQQQLRQPPLGHGAEEIHHRQGAAAMVAHPDRAGVLTPARTVEDRYTEVARVLNQRSVLNLLVAIAKIILGTATGAVSILSDGFHR